MHGHFCLDICIYDTELHDLCSAPNLQSMLLLFFQPANSGIKSTMTGRSRAVGISAPIPHLKTLQVSAVPISISFLLYRTLFLLVPDDGLISIKDQV